MSAPLDDLLGNTMTEHVADADVEVSVVDDRPAEDQVPARDEDRSSSDDEIDDVGGRAGKRISRLKYEYHEERRNKETAVRMQEEAVRYAQQVDHQNRELRSILERGEKVLLSEIHSRTDSELSSAKEKYRKAYESGDTDSIVEAQEELSRSVLERDQAEKYQPVVEGQNQQAVQQQAMRQQAAQQQAMRQRYAMQQQAAQQQATRKQPVDPKLATWMAKNEWFGKDPERTQFAYGVHERLVNEGADPRTDEYYEKIDDRMGEVFPQVFDGQGTEDPAGGQRMTTVVAPARRVGGNPRKVQLTSTQVTLAKRLGISPEQYAKQLMKEN